MFVIFAAAQRLREDSSVLRLIRPDAAADIAPTRCRASSAAARAFAGEAVKKIWRQAAGGE